MANKTYKLPKVTQYVKNVGKSVAYASIDSVKGNLSGVSEFFSSNDEILKKGFHDIKNIRQTLRKTEREIKKSALYKSIDTGVKNFIEDAKSGNWYNDRKDELYKSMMGDDDGFDFEDFDMSSSMDITTSSPKSD